MSGTSRNLRDHYRSLANRLIVDRTPNNETLVVDIAANDGTLLSIFREKGAQVLGIEPAPIPARHARRTGIEIVDQYFNEKLAECLTADGMRADIIIANNVLAHVPDPGDFLRGLSKLLKPDGIASIEVGWAGDMIESVAFDSIYHQHRCYFSLIALEPLVARAGLTVRQIETLPLQGISLRLTLGHDGTADDSVDEIRRDETKRGLRRIETYMSFGKAAHRTAEEVGAFIRQLKTAGAKIAAYGAAAKGTTLLHAAGLGRAEIDFVVDKNPEKIGRFMPGSGLPIEPPDKLTQDFPDYILLLAWNYLDEVMAQESAYIDRGGRFILPFPVPRIVP